jgi:nucleoid-associated protein YgaU
MPSPFFHQDSLGPAKSAGAGGLGTGSKELAYSGLSGGSETGLGVTGGGPLSGQEAASAAAAKASAEASALAGKALLGKTAVGTAGIAQGAISKAAIGQMSVGNAAIGQAAVGNAAITHATVGNAALAHAAMPALMPGAEQVSPLVQLIMRMPGAMGVANSFFEWLAHLFAPGGHDLMGALGGLHLDLAGHVAALEHAGGLLEIGQHISTSLTSLSTDGSLMQGLQHAGTQLNGLDKAFNAGGISEHFMQNPANIGAGPDLAHAQFEKAAAGSIDGTLSGPAVSGSSSGGFLAGNQRLFGDSIGGGGRFNSITSNTGVPVTGTSPAVNNATSTTMSQQISGIRSTPAAAPADAVARTGSAASDAGAASAQSASVAPESAASQQSVGPSSFGERYANNNLIAKDVPDYHPSTSANQGSQTGEITPLHAKQLTFEDMRHGVVGNHGKQLIEKIAGKHAPGFQAEFGSPRIASTNGISNHAGNQAVNGGSGNNINHHDSALPKAHSQSAGTEHIAQHHEVAQHHLVPQHHQIAQHHQVAHHENIPKHAAKAVAKSADSHAPTDATKGIGQDQRQIAQSGDAASYTVHRGDSLWSVAQRQLGDGSRWSELYKLNADLLGKNPDMIFSGTHLRLPGADQMISDAGKYMVKPGDNLWSIAKDHLGGAAKWTDIYKANMGTIGSNPRLIMPGQQLSLPMANPAVAAQFPSSGAGSTLASATPAASSGTGMDMTQAVQTTPQMSMQPPAVMDAQVMPAAGVRAIGIPGAADAGIAAGANGGMQFSSTQPFVSAPGAAGAATLKSAAGNLVSNSLKPDLSFLDKRGQL